jgi:hypothetical protein
MELFYCRGDIIEFLYRIKEQINSYACFISDNDIDYFYKCIENDIPKSKFFDVDVSDLMHDVEESLDNWVYMKVRFFKGNDFNQGAVVLN